VAAELFPNKMVLASSNFMSFTAEINSGVASFTAFSAARLRAFKPSSAKLLNPIF